MVGLEEVIGKPSAGFWVRTPPRGADYAAGAGTWASHLAQELLLMFPFETSELRKGPERTGIPPARAAS
jgi:hypothetical protein